MSVLSLWDKFCTAFRRLTRFCFGFCFGFLRSHTNLLVFARGIFFAVANFM